ncbi:hypothetical protein LOK49_LG08G00702 [Camellia lanceoleosa]|uniref:Uncharacterized protein n=1 Tax=Camellia lanceoleosa TaxID=1840588 RepID=A0ACC0GSU9_9ERIC|nr:hypothetical protein LOK49_LG08G00702 [Camellia lanceoleosa]
MNFLANPRIDPMFVQHADSEGSSLDIIHNAYDLLSRDIKIPKFHGGSISKGSELQIEVAEFSWRNVQLRGSLKVVAENILGSTRMDENGVEDVSYRMSSNRMKELIDFKKQHIPKHDVQMFEALKRESDAKNLQNKSFSYFDSWIHIFGKDRATREFAEGPADAVDTVNAKEKLLFNSLADDGTFLEHMGISSHIGEGINCSKFHQVNASPKVLQKE